MEGEALIKHLISKRGSIKSQITWFNKHFDKVKSEAVTAQSLGELRMRLTRIEGIWDNFDTIQTELESIVTDVDAEYSQRETFQNMYFLAISTVEQFLLQHEKANDDLQSLQSVHSALSQVPSSRSPLHIKLPTISLPNFDGNYMRWTEFHDTFTAIVHRNNDISPAQKMCYLRSSLSGDAAGVIRSFEISDVNYEIAWDLLKRRYDNKRRIIMNHGRALLGLATISKESHVNIRKLIDTVQQHLRCLQTLNQPTDSWDALLVPLIISKLDINTNREWETWVNSDNFGDDNETIPTKDDLIKFLTQKCNTLEAIATKQTTSESKPITSSNVKSHSNSANTRKSFVTSNVCCFHCKGEHAIYQCPDFLKLSINARVEQVKKLNLCINCLRANHRAADCTLGKCRKCSRKHNSLLHFENPTTSNVLATASNLNEEASFQAPTTNMPTVSTNKTSVLSSSVDVGSTQVLLATALVHVLDSHGNTHTCRALLDCGSQSNFISTSLFNKLNLDRVFSKVSIVGINHVTSSSHYKCNVQIHSKVNNYKFSLSCLILPTICESLPSAGIDISKFNIPNNLKLADPGFSTPGNIDILLGADTFWQLICVGQIKLGIRGPTLQKTLLGWLVSGPINNKYCRQTHCNLSTNADIQNQLAKFWEIEEMPTKRAFSKEEKQCESHFVENVQRDETGRFTVSIPFKDTLNRLGNSYETAKKRFHSLERKFQNNRLFHEMYVQFMEEYATLNHMSVVKADNTSQSVYYMPHHGVLKENSTTTKLRVVFDGSCPTSTGVSINNLQMVGPTIQSDLISILLRFREHPIVISADITKMYRQVNINPSQRPLQRILWRSNSTEPLLSFELNTVTYGTAAASFLAIRCLHELAHENYICSPEASQVIIDDFYVDDLLTGTEIIEKAVSICDQVDNILKKGGFELRKWTSNKPIIFEHFPQFDVQHSTLDFGINANSKTLGLLWISTTDQLSFNIETASHQPVITKRIILSSASQIFDPLGLLSACTIIAKILLQELWQAKLSWDEVVPMEIHTKWIRFRNELCELNNLRIPRYVFCDAPINRELHCFSDASESAYGACAYVRSVCIQGTVSVQLLCAKSKVAPLKPLSIPRLELSGALVATRLATKVISASKIPFTRCYFWCDSKIVLAWISTPANLLKTFVCNRVAEIQEKTESHVWNHVISKDNPGDLLSRGVSPVALSKSELWWHGPDWLALSKHDWPISASQPPPELPELKSTSHSMVVVQDFDIFDRYSSLHKLQSIIAYCFRFVRNSQVKIDQRNTLPLTVVERLQALDALIKLAQQTCFEDEVDCIKRSGDIKVSSKLLGLCPFLDEKGLLRVGGRLSNSELDFDKRHPIILPPKHTLSRLIATQEHTRLMHCGPQHLLSSMRDRYWPIGGRNLTKQVTHQCIRCFRSRPKPLISIMGNLPKDRVMPTPPFYNCGVDYAGPILTKNVQGRGSKTYKSYVCLFICFCTKAIHLELVSDLTSECFIAAFRRFTARRGKPANVYSDNGTNFVGAHKELQDLGNFLLSNSQVITNSFITDNTQWHFIPASSPHFGGLWEAGVKSTKHHLKRVVGNTLLTFEDFLTVITQIESILNSRPLYPMSSNPHDLEPLTPAHFLIGRKLTTLPDPDVQHLQENRLSRYQKLQQIHQHFWARWSKEYLSELQQRMKWKKKGMQIELGSLVLIKEDNLPPLQWRLGRITQLHPGNDGVVRVVSIQTNNGIVKRSIVKICPFPKET